MKYYIGIDGGGTKSRLLAVDQDRRSIDLLYGESTNLASNTKEFVTRTLNDLFSALFANNNLEPENCLGLCIGSAGLDYDANRMQMNEIIRESGFVCPVLAVNDSLAVLAAATGGKTGVVLISGTGSIAYGIDSKGNTTRVGGWGHIVDDAGSGYWIGREALRHAFLAYDKRGEKTILEDAFKECFGIDDLPKCMVHIYGENALGKAEIADFAVMVKEGAQKNDNICLRILRNAAKELFIMVDAVLNSTSGENPDVTVSGGNIIGNEILFSEFKTLINKAHPDLHIHKLDKEPVFGAVYLAMEQTEKEGVSNVNSKNHNQ